MKKLTLPSGLTYGYDQNNQKICTGSMMGRRNEWPLAKQDFPIKLRLVKLRLNCGNCYDKGGAYWGNGEPLYWCVGEDCSAFLRATNRLDAKRQIRQTLPKAKFYN